MSILIGGENVMDADNQQERLKRIGWIVGFIDGEGCFSVTIQKSPSMSTGWQIFPEFVVTQGAKSFQSLEEIKNFFDCGKIFVNRRYDNHKESLYRYCVRSVKDLKEKIIPFFKQNLLRTSKKEDFKKFVEIMEMFDKGGHLKIEGISKIAQICQSMNRKKPSRFLASSETIRQTS